MRFLFIFLLLPFSSFSQVDLYFGYNQYYFFKTFNSCFFTSNAIGYLQSNNCEVTYVEFDQQGNCNHYIMHEPKSYADTLKANIVGMSKKVYWDRTDMYITHTTYYSNDFTIDIQERDKSDSCFVDFTLPIQVQLYNK